MGWDRGQLIKRSQTQQQNYTLQAMADRTINFPKLKNTPQTTTTATLHSLTHTLKTIPISQSAPISRLPSYKDKLAHRKYTYINKSPEYFKRRQNSQYYIKPLRETDGSIIEDLSEQMQKYEKNPLQSGHPVWTDLFHKSKNQKPKQTRKKTMIDQLDIAQQPNYDNFKAPSIGMRHLFGRAGA